VVLSWVNRDFGTFTISYLTSGFYKIRPDFERPETFEWFQAAQQSWPDFQDWTFHAEKPQAGHTDREVETFGERITRRSVQRERPHPRPLLGQGARMKNGSG